jgi:hypothetical protein
MGRLLALVSSVMVIGWASWAQDEHLAREGRGLLPAPVELPARLGGNPPEHSFVSDPSGGFSRTLFETDENPHFKLVVREFSFPPDHQTHTVTLSSTAIIHFLSEPGEISIAQQRVTLTAATRTIVPAGAPVEVVNHGEHPLVMRVLIVEAK